MTGSGAGARRILRRTHAESPANRHVRLMLETVRRRLGASRVRIPPLRLLVRFLPVCRCFMAGRIAGRWSSLRCSTPPEAAGARKGLARGLARGRARSPRRRRGGDPRQRSSDRLPCQGDRASFHLVTQVSRQAAAKTRSRAQRCPSALRGKPRPSCDRRSGSTRASIWTIFPFVTVKAITDNTRPRGATTAPAAPFTSAGLTNG